MKYKVLETCHAGGRMCRKGAIIESTTEIKNKYLEEVADGGQDAPKKEKNPDQKPLSSLGNKPEIKTGMAAKKKKEKEDK